MIACSVLALFATAQGCAANEEGEEEDEGALTEDSGKVIPTAQTDLLLYQGYNTVFDQGHHGCVTFGEGLTPTIGDVGVDVKIALVRSREELARSLGFETDLAFKLPKVGADARAQVMNSFKRNASTTTLLVRVGSYYFVDAGQNYSLTPTASALLERDPRAFLQRCGDAVVTKLQYRAEVIGLMKFDTNDTESATKASGGVGAEGTVGSVADAKGKVSGTYERMNAASRSSMNLELYTQGFAPGADISLDNLQGDQAMGRLEQLLKKMADSIAADRERDVAAVREGKMPVQRPDAAPAPETTVVSGAETPPAATNRNVLQRAARLGGVTFHGYAKREERPMATITQITHDANKFLLEVGDVQGRLENTYYEEVNAFLQATDQEAYNLSTVPVTEPHQLEAPAQKWSALLKPAQGSGTVAALLKDAQLKCVRMGIAGDYTQCAKTEAITKLLADGNKQLEDYAREGRIVRMNLLYGSPGKVTVDVARDACTRVGGRFPEVSEMKWLAPALKAKGGFAWVTSNLCSGGIGIYSGATEPKCYNGLYWDWFDNLVGTDAANFCVANAGPRAALARPGE